jgi:hypothetical protein
MEELCDGPGEGVVPGNDKCIHFGQKAREEETGLDT